MNLFCGAVYQATIVFGNPDPRFAEILDNIPEGKHVVDLVRIVPDWKNDHERYHGIGW